MEFIKIWEILLRRKLIVLGVFFSIFATVVIATHLISPTYEAKAKLLLQAGSTQALIVSNLGLRGFETTLLNDIDTNISLLSIRPVVEELINELGIKKLLTKPLSKNELAESLAALLVKKDN